ncbi:MAG: hypothetical protein KZQ83_00585 [gamma proteobacterium symbiont of Taylorina sp.]|nr:hypothetical protein [gamma proteobacterium symbiont of Taylorina sp.]
MIKIISISIVVLFLSVGVIFADRLHVDDLVYQGAFRLPIASNNSSWEYSGLAMTCYPEGDPQGTKDGFPGSIFAVGHDQQQSVSEISIPIPVISTEKNLHELNTATTLQAFQNIAGNLFYDNIDELSLPRMGLAYLPAQQGQTSGKLHFTIGQHIQGFEASHAWTELDLTISNPAGAWHFGSYTNYVTNDYMLDIPAEWATINTAGQLLATGRAREGLWSGRGPALFSYAPWSEGNPPADNSTLSNITPLLLYGVQENGATDIISDESTSMVGYSDADHWLGSAWLTSGDKSALIFSGTKAIGNSWYGFANGVIWHYDCAEQQPPTCPEIPAWPSDDRGFWAENYQAQLIFYDTDDLAAVALGTIPSYQPQPYAVLDLTPYLFDAEISLERYRNDLVGATCFDRTHQLLYLFERQADEEKSVVHVWKVGGFSPLAAIQVDGRSDEVRVTANTPVSITISLKTDLTSSAKADWWVAYVTDGKGYTYVYPSGWSTNLKPTYQGELFNFSSFNIFNESLSVGNYIFFFGVDTIADGNLSVDNLHYDYITVEVQ